MAEEQECCCSVPELTIREGERVCVNCGVVKQQALFFEDVHPELISDTCIKVNSLNAPCADEMNPFDSACGQIVTRVCNNNSKQRHWFYKMNTIVNYTYRHRIAWKLRDTACRIVNALHPVSIDLVLHCIYHILNRWVETNENKHTSGSNRLGVIAFCVYRGTRTCKECFQYPYICSLMGIPHAAFFKARLRLYEWNVREKSAMDWFFHDDSSRNEP